MCLSLNDLTDAPWAHAVLGGQLDLVPGPTAQIVQPEGSLTGAYEHIPPFLRVVHWILQHESCRVNNMALYQTQIWWGMLLLHQLDTRGQQSTTLCSSLATSYQETLIKLQFAARRSYQIHWNGCFFIRLLHSGHQKSCRERTSDGAATIVPRDPSQGDGGGGGGGDGQSRLIRRNWTHTQRQWVEANCKHALHR